MEYKLLMWYPTLPKDWVVGMEIGQGDRGSCGDYSPCSSEYTDKRLYISEVQDNPTYWEKVIEEYEILSFLEVIDEDKRLFEKRSLGLFGISGSILSYTLYDMLHTGKCVDNGCFKINSVKRLSDGVIFSLGDICSPLKSIDNIGPLTSIEFCEVGYLRLASQGLYYTGIKGLNHVSVEFEILKWRLKGTNNTISTLKRGGTELEDSWEIYSVKRMSDGVIFTICDTVKCKKLPPNQWFRIKGFQMDFDNTHLLALKEFSGAIGVRKIEHYNAPLFKTEDGVDIFDGDTYVVLFPNEGTIYGAYNAHKGMKVDCWLCPYLNFSTRDKAKEYIDFNTPKYSMKDIMAAIDEHFAVESRTKIIDLDKLAK